MRLSASLWEPSNTWDSLGAGVSADGAEAASYFDGVFPADNFSGVWHSVDVTASLQAWVECGDLNGGWALLPGGTDGWDFCSAEGTYPPQLIVEYDARPLAFTRFQQGVDGIYLFNFHCALMRDQTRDLQVLGELGDPALLQRRNKLYVVAGVALSYQGYSFGMDRYTPNPLQLPRDLPVGGEGATVRFAVGDDLQRRLKGAPKAEGHDRIYVHGEKEYEEAERRSRDGIPLNPKVVADLRALGKQVGVVCGLEPESRNHES